MRTMITLLLCALLQNTYPAPGPGRQAPSAKIRNSNITSSASTASLAVSMPSGAQVGDLAVCYAGAENGALAATGWTKAGSTGTINHWNGTWLYKSSPAATYPAG